MPTRLRSISTAAKRDLRNPQHFTGTLSVGDRSMPVRFKTRIRDDGEVDIDLHAFRITEKTRFVRERWQSGHHDVAEFALSGLASDGLRFDSDSLSFSNLGERWSGIHGRHWSKPQGALGKAQFFRKLAGTRDRPILKLHLKGFDCFPALYAKSMLGAIRVAGQTNLGEPDRLTGWIMIEAGEPPLDVSTWRTEAQELVEHLRRILSIGAATMLQAPILEFEAADTHEAEVLSQTRQHAPVMRVFHKLALQPALDAAIASFFTPPFEARNLFFAVEWFAMATAYNEVRLVNAMTALENLIDSNLTAEEGSIEPRREFDKTRKVLRKVVRACLDRWSPDHEGARLEEIDEKLLDLNRRSLRRKLHILAARWKVPLEGISDAQISDAIKARNAVVHRGYHPAAEEGPDLWHHMTVVRELVTRFLLTAIGYRGQYISHVDGYHLTHFPPKAINRPNVDPAAS